MSKCRYDLSKDCHNKDCLVCVLDKIRAEIKHYSEHFINDDGEDCFAVYEDDVLKIIDKYRKAEE